MKGWLKKYDVNANDSNVTVPEGFVGMGNDTKGRNYSPAWGGSFQNGGITKSFNPYVEYIDNVEEEFPYNGKSKYKGGYDIEKALEIYEPDETGHLPSVDYRTGEWLKDKDYPTAWKEFYETQTNPELYKQVGFPIQNEKGRLQYMKGYRNGGEIMNVGSPQFPIARNGIVRDNNGYWNPDNWGKPVEIDSNEITMRGVNVPLMGISDTGDTKMMLPGQDYHFRGKRVTELPIAQDGKLVPGTPEYKTAYESGHLTNYDPETDTYVATPLSGPTITPKLGWLDTWGKNIAEESKDAGLLNAMIGVPINAALSLPQMVMVSAFTGEPERPSEAMDLEGSWKGAVADLLLDPLILGPALNSGRKLVGKGYKEVVNAAAKNELYKLNPFAVGEKENLAYRRITANRASSLLQGDPALRYGVTKGSSYHPVLDEAGNISHYVVKNNLERFIEHGGDKTRVSALIPIGKKRVKLVSTTLGDIKTGKFKKPAISFNVGDKTFPISPRTNKTELVNELYGQAMKSSKAYSELSPDVRFTWGKVSNRKGVGTEPTNIILSADPTKISLVGAPTKGEKFRYIPKDIGNFNIGKTTIPEESIINKTLTMRPGLKMLKLDPVKGYIPLTPAEEAKLIVTGKFTQEQPKLIKSILKFDDALNTLQSNLSPGRMITELKGVPNKFITPLKSINASNFIDAVTFKQNAIRNEYNNVGKAFDATKTLSHEVGSELAAASSNAWKRAVALADKISPEGNRLYNLRQEKSYDLSKYNQISNSYTMDDTYLYGVNKNRLASATTTGKKDVVHFRTNTKVTADVQVPGIAERYKKGYKITDNSGKPYTPIVKDQVKSEELKMNQEYIDTVKDNINYIEETIPGAKVFGSARGIADANLPHISNDYDVFMSESNYRKHASKLEFIGNNGPAKQHRLDPKFGDQGIIDINVVEEAPDGTATGKLAQELYKQFYPDEYFKSARQAIIDDSPIKIPYTPDELVKNVNPTKKTIIDAYEAYRKPKQINRIDSYISFGNPEVVREAQESYIKTLVGKKGNLGHQFQPEQFADIESNKLLLDEIDFIGDVNFVARDPQKMQVALNDFYINNTVLSRGVGVHSNRFTKEDIDLAENALKIWKPESGGGQGMGAGQNHVVHGDSGHGPFYGNKQLGLNLNTDNPRDYVNSIKKQTDGNFIFSEEEYKDVISILDKYKITGKPKTPGQLIELVSYESSAKPILNEVAKATGIRSVKTKPYGESLYSSTMTDFDETLDALEFALRDQITIPKSYSIRKSNLEKMYNNPVTIKNFDKIKNILSGGLQRAEERYKQVEKNIEEFESLQQRIRDRVYSGDKKLRDLQNRNEKLVEELYNLKEKRRELELRLMKVENIQTILKNIGIAGSIPAAIFTASKLMPPSRSGQRKAQKQKQVPKKEFGGAVSQLAQSGKMVSTEEHPILYQNPDEKLFTPQYPFTYPSGFRRSYLNSPKYKERLKNRITESLKSDYEELGFDADFWKDEINRYTDDAIKKSIKEFNKGKLIIGNDSTGESNYQNNRTRDIYLDNDDKVMDYLPHELSHKNSMLDTSVQLDTQYLDIFDRYIPRDESQVMIKDYAKKYVDPTWSNFSKAIMLSGISNITYDNDSGTHDISPEEVKADIDRLRFFLYKKGIYDARTQDFNKNHLEKAKQLFKDDLSKRLFDAYSEDDLIHLMNTVAQNKLTKQQEIPTAKIGGAVSQQNDRNAKQLEQLTNFTNRNKPGDWLNKYA